MDDQRFSLDKTVAEVSTLEHAELIRKALLGHPSNLTVYVYVPTNDGDLWRITVASKDSVALSGETVTECIDFCSEIIASWPPDHVDTEEVVVMAAAGSEYMLETELLETEEFLPPQEEAGVKEDKQKV